MVAIVIKGELSILRSPSQTCHAKPKTQPRRTLASFFPVGGCHRKQLGLKKTFSEKSGRCGIAVVTKERGAFTYDDRGDICQAIDR